MADRVVAKVPEIVDYAKSISGLSSGTHHGKDSIMSSSTTANQALSNMSELVTTGLLGSPEVFAEAYQVGGYLAVNAKSFQQFIQACGKGIQCTAMAAQAIATILHYTDADSAGKFDATDVADAMAYAMGDPGAERPDGIPKKALGTKTQLDQDVENASRGGNQADAIAFPNDPNATTTHYPGEDTTTTTYSDGSYRVVESYLVTGANGSSTVHQTTRFYDSNGKEISNSAQTEDTEYGNGYRTTTRSEGGTTSSTTIRDDGSVDVTTTTKDAQGHPVTKNYHEDPPTQQDQPEKGPIEGWYDETHIDGSGSLGGAYGGY
ncbi:hypothetical protein Athai_07650 [Actinocatenispora thailandica]|uniref:Uncharacterized protein n=1 Tax=Actinocatenispora thailandica TaxID=227318 RepID=A0A7R7HUQ8_9ACTN|nr:hypothetical protein [Actinocatenispora thailandica]BCJ33262.1 hypothetical protein Athai_07650 [Actinocatenispora thailandica]